MQQEAREQEYEGNLRQWREKGAGLLRFDSTVESEGVRDTFTRFLLEGATLAYRSTG